MSLPELPPELVLEIYSYLPVQSLLSISATSHRSSKFILENEAAIYHKAALLHSFIPSPKTTLQEALSTCPGKLYEGTNAWKEFCKRRLQLEWNWLGEGQSVIRTMHSAGDNVHRIKVDEKEQICITTHSNGGLIVSQLLPDRVLWSLPKEYVREYAHCEYSNGYVIFDRRGNTKEVWRLAEHIDPEDAQIAPASPPDQWQWLFSDRMESKYGPPSRGHFRPWALLAMPEWTRAYRFVHPTLLSAGERTAFLHDVRTGALAQQFDIRAVQRVSYVELSARHVLICAEDLSVYSRADGTLVLTIDASMEIGRTLRVQPAHPRDASSSNVAVPATMAPEPYSSLSGVTAAHISADGRDLVVLYDEPAVLIVPDFERVCRKELALKDAGVTVWLEDDDVDAAESTYLAFDHGRICVATSTRLVLLHLDASAHYAHSHAIYTSTFPRAGPLPHLAACALPPLDGHPALPDLSCVQLSDRRVFFTWNASFRPAHVEPYVAPGEPPPPPSNALVVWVQPAGGGGVDPDGPERLNVGVVDFSILDTHADGAG